MDIDRQHSQQPPSARQAIGRRPSLPSAAAAVAIASGALALASLLAPAAARADDRSLLHATQQNPYVMIILDTSGSMHQEVACTAADVAAGFCLAECDAGNCLPRMMGDDPDSKIYVAKQSIYTIMQSHPNINFGFAHFDQTQLQMFWKYWWYAVAPSQPTGFITLDSGLQYPESGQQELFGQQAWSCTAGGPLPYSNVGCISTQPAHLDNPWEWERARRFPKLGDTNNAAAYSYYITESSSGGTPTYKVTFTPVVGQTIGSSSMLVSIRVDKCLNSACSSISTKGTKSMTFNLANQTVYWETGQNLNGTNIPDSSGNGGAFYGGTNAAGATTVVREIQANYSSANLQLEGDADTTTNDPWKSGGTCVADPRPVCTGLPFGTNTCDMMQPTCTDPSGRGPGDDFSIGDIIPLDWKTNQQTAILQRMAPNLLNVANTVPDFGIADYMADHPLAGDTGLRLKDPTQRPLAPEGGTPTGNVMASFFALMTGLTPKNLAGPPGGFKAASSSWIGTASGAGGDAFFSCKPAYVLLLTDGLASSDDGLWNADSSLCPAYKSWGGKPASPTPGYACCVAEALRQVNYGATNTAYPIRTYVIGLGLTSTTVGGYNNTLQCIADEGGTGNRHFFNGNKAAGTPPGFPTSDPPPAGFCSTSNPCDGPGPILPQSKQDILNALENILNLISSQATAFASAAVPSIQSNVQNKELITSFLPINAPIWPGRVDAFSDPVPTHTVQVTLPDGSVTSAVVPDPTVLCTSPTQQGCHLWNAGGGQLQGGPTTTDTVYLQGLQGLDTAGNAPAKRRIYYAPFTPVVPGELRLNFTMPAVTDTAHLFDLENALGLCGAGYSFYPPSSAVCTNNALPVGTICTNAPLAFGNPCPSGQTISTAPYTTAQQAVTFAESIKTYLDPTTTKPVQYLLGDIFHSDPQVLGQPINATLFDANLDGYQTFANAERFRRKVLYFGSDDGEFHALDVGTVQQGTVAGLNAWTFNNGTGNEIFAFIPRTVMPTLDNLGIAAAPPLNGGAQTFMVDGPPHLTEGFFDATGAVPNCWATSPAPASCQWHSVVIGGLREGGHGYYALDVTQPDVLVSNFETPNDSTTPAIQLPNPSASTYLPSCLNTTAGCGQLPYPTPLWEFNDSVKVVPGCSTNCQLKPNDEDASGAGLGHPDLGETWSRPNSGRVRICDTSACTSSHERWVVVFGGGMDPTNSNTQGNWLYMLDMATGSLLYKRALTGSVPSEPAAVDTGQDGFIDTIYIGTTAGHLYKVDLTSAAPIDSVSNRVSTAVNPVTGQPYWQPFEIFNTGGRPIYYPPAVFLDTDRNQFGLAFGTGNRFDLWTNAAAIDTNANPGRFYVVIDTGFTAPMTPLTETSFQMLTPDGALNPGSNFLLSPPASKQPGYFFSLPGDGIAADPNERVLSEPFALSGLLIFASYVPKQLTAVGNNNSVCADSGDTHVFLLNINNGDAISSQVGGEGTGTPTGTSNRYFVLSKDLGLNISTAESTPIIVTKANPNPPPEPPLSAAVKDVMAQIMKLMPPTCRFTNKRVNVNVTDTFNTTYNVGAVPVCIVEKNWKEF